MSKELPVDSTLIPEATLPNVGYDPVTEINEAALNLIVKIEGLGLTRAASHVRLAADMVNQHFTK